MNFQAYKKGLYGSSYVWILAAPTLHQGWLTPEDTDCTMEELLQATEGYFTLHNLIMSTSEEPTITGKVSRLSSSPTLAYIIDEKVIYMNMEFVFSSVVKVDSCSRCFVVVLLSLLLLQLLCFKKATRWFVKI